MPHGFSDDSFLPEGTVYDNSTIYRKTLAGTDNEPNNPNELVQINLGKGELETYDLGGRFRIVGVDGNVRLVKSEVADIAIDCSELVIEGGAGLEISQGREVYGDFDRGIKSSQGGYATVFEEGVTVRNINLPSNVKADVRVYLTALGFGKYAKQEGNYYDETGKYHYLNLEGVAEWILGYRINVDIYEE